jgi:predicted secreted protein
MIKQKPILFLKIIFGLLLMSIFRLTVALASDLTLTGVQGKQLSLTIANNGSTGSSLMIKSLPDNLIFAGSQYSISERCPKGWVGCPGKETLYFIAQHPGDGELLLIKGRPFEQKTWSTFKVKVHIN